MSPRSDQQRCAHSPRAVGGHRSNFIVDHALTSAAQSGRDDADQIACRQPPAAEPFRERDEIVRAKADSSSASAPRVSTSVRRLPPRSAVISPRYVLDMNFFH
jgi:hypothetical protein